MLASIASYAPAIVAGSALSGFGFAIGRDVYRQAKKRWLWVLILVCLVGVFFSGLWLFRNYRTIAGATFKRIGALIVLGISAFGIHIASGIIFTFTDAVLFGGELMINYFSYMLAGNWFEPPLLYVMILELLVFMVGAMIGFRHRRKRAIAWGAEDHNNAFMEKHGLQITDADDKGNLRIREIATNTGYRLIENLDVTGEMEFMALGRRNKRAYMKYDGSGKFVHWTGLVEVR